jgi:hypothetical protein
MDHGMEVTDKGLGALKFASLSTDPIVYPRVDVLRGTRERPREDEPGHTTAKCHVVMHKPMPLVQESSAVSKFA